jgi:hypothetical protein
MQYKTPGVYLQDTTPPRPNVPVLETAVPAFVGYTAKAQDEAGRPLLLKPTRIRDMGEFGRLFGGPFLPEAYRIYLRPSGQAERVEVQDRFFLYDSLLHYFDNGGGECYIVSVGSYLEGKQPAPLAGVPVVDDCLPEGLLPPPAPPSEPFMTELARFQQGIDSLALFDEPTLILFPDAVRFRRAADGSPDYGSLGQLQAYALRHCAKMQDRFALFDLIPAGCLSDTLSFFRDALGAEQLSYGAAYHPWLYTRYAHRFHLRELAFYDAASGLPLSDAQLSPSQGAGGAASPLLANARRAGEETGLLLSLMGLSRSEAADAPGRFRDLLRRYEQEAAAVPPGDASPLASFRQLADFLRRLAAAFARLDQQVSVALQEVLEGALPGYSLPNSIRALVAAENSPRGAARYVEGPDSQSQKLADYAALSGTRWLGNASAGDIPAASYATDAELAAALRPLGEQIGAAASELYRVAEAAEQSADSRLFAQHPLLKEVAAAIALEMQRIPPSGTLAGIYVATDADRGIWKAPANVALRETLGPAEALGDREQESLNVHETGKAVNAIRSFPGRGAVVWGARTLLANSLEWRYVPVRRLFIYAEEFLKKAAEPFVFEPNDANTWLRLRNLADSFLRNLWRRGALYGATAEEAYFIAVGLGETMTAQDILEGKLIAEIGMAAARPAEFILIRYECRMEEN